MTTFKYNA